MQRLWIVAATLLAASTLATPAHAINITLTEVTSGNRFPGSNGTAVGPDSTCMFPNTASAAQIRAVVRAAADYWQTIYTLPFTINISWGFSTAPTGNADAPLISTQSGGSGNGIITAGVVRFARNPVSCWYVDSNPGTWSEYPSSGRATSEQIPYWNRPGSMVEVGRFTDRSSSGNTNHQDLFTTALHEIGHLLGLHPAIARYSTEVSDGDIDVVTWHVCPDLSWMSSGGHLTFNGNPRMLMFPGGAEFPSRRVWPSQADISTISQISGWWTTNWGAGGGGVTGVAARNAVNR